MMAGFILEPAILKSIEKFIFVKYNV